MSTTANLTDQIIEFETGNLNEAETVRLFQELVDTGLVWHLQGSYGRAAQRLLNAGLIKPPKASKRNPRPPKVWFDNTKRRLKREYPRYNRETKQHYEKAITQIAGGIWWKYPAATRQRLIAEYD